MGLHLPSWDYTRPLQAHAWRGHRQRRGGLPRGGEDSLHWEEAQAEKPSRVARPLVRDDGR